MADWYGTARSNYFRVKDEAAFRETFGKVEVEIVTDTQGRFGLLARDEYGGWPSYTFEDDLAAGDDDEPQDFDIVATLSEHLATGEVAVLMEVGNEKMRYVTGRAIAVNGRNETAIVDLNDIYDLARGLGENVTLAEY